MSNFFGFLNVAMVCFTVWALAFTVVLAMPHSRMRDVMKKVLFAMACGIYIISPIDLMPEAVLGPFGLIDDFGALVAGVASLHSAIRVAA